MEGRRGGDRRAEARRRRSNRATNRTLGLTCWLRSGATTSFRASGAPTSHSERAQLPFSRSERAQLPFSHSERAQLSFCHSDRVQLPHLSFRASAASRGICIPRGRDRCATCFHAEAQRCAEAQRTTLRVEMLAPPHFFSIHDFKEGTLGSAFRQS